MRASPSSPSETYKVLRFMGALILAIATLIVLNVMIGPEASTDNAPDVQSQHVEFPAPAQPVQQINS